MTPEERDLLENTYKLAKENNFILITIRRGNRISMALRATYWILIILFSFGAYYLIQPYLSFLTGLGSEGIKNASEINTASSFLKDYQDLLK